MESILPLIEGHEKLTSLYNCWPEFHDAEVIDLHFWRGHVLSGDWDDRNVFPVLTVKIRVLQAVQKDSQLKKPDVLTTLRFHNVDDFRMEGFNHANQIVDFTIQVKDRGTFTDGKPLPPHFVVSFVEGFGLKASFRCFRIEVLEAQPVATDGPL